MPIENRHVLSIHVYILLYYTVPKDSRIVHMYICVCAGGIGGAQRSHPLFYHRIYMQSVYSRAGRAWFFLSFITPHRGNRDAERRSKKLYHPICLPDFFFFFHFIEIELAARLHLLATDKVYPIPRIQSCAVLRNLYTHICTRRRVPQTTYFVKKSTYQRNIHHKSTTLSYNDPVKHYNESTQRYTTY